MPGTVHLRVGVTQKPDIETIQEVHEREADGTFTLCTLLGFFTYRRHGVKAWCTMHLQSKRMITCCA
jgi:hypothetical protein